MEDVFHIIRALDQRCAVHIAYQVELRRLQVNVVNTLAGWTVAPTRDTTQQLIVTYLNAYCNERKTVRIGRQTRVQPLCLSQSAGVTVQDVPTGCVWLG